MNGVQTERERYQAPAYAQVGGIRLCYDAFGDPGAPPLVLVMGLASQMVVWDDDFCAGLAGQGFRVVRFDNRDIGLSTRLDGARTPSAAELVLAGLTGVRGRAPYTLTDMARDTAGLLDALGLASAHVVGISMGGAIAQELAIRAPDRLRTLTSIMATTGDPRVSRPQPRAMAALFKRPPADRAGYLRNWMSTWAVLNGPHLPFDAERIRRQGEISYARGINPPGAARQLLAIIASGDRTAALRRVRAPALVIHGSADPLVPVEAGRATARALSGAELLVIEGMGHTLPRLTWPRVIGAIAAHAARHDAAAAGRRGDRR